MKGSFLIPSHTSDVDSNIFANKSSIVLYWLLLIGITKDTFSIREVARECNLSVSLVQRIFKILVLKGYLYSEGFRTSKKFMLRNPKFLLKNWLNNYKITEKCKMWTYHSVFQSKKQIFQALIKNNLEKKVVLALHSAAEAYGYKNTNLNTIEFYILQPDLRFKMEKKLLLEPQEKGYEVLLIKPYYKSILNIFSEPYKLFKNKNLLCAPILLNYLDLYNFPLRGKEQAQFMKDRIKNFQRIYNYEFKKRR